MTRRTLHAPILVAALLGASFLTPASRPSVLPAAVPVAAAAVIPAVSVSLETTAETSRDSGALTTGTPVSKGAAGVPLRQAIVSATWYCRPGRSICTRHYPAAGHYAAAGYRVRALLGPHWRGRTVLVCTAATRFPPCVSVRLIDVCACVGIDLYASAFRHLAPLSRGRIRVAVVVLR